MDWSRALFWLAAGILLVAVNVVYVRGVHRVLFADAGRNRIPPFRVVRAGGVTEGEGMSLAHLLVARIAEIERRMERVQDALRETSETTTSLRQDRPRRDHLRETPTVFLPLELDVQVGGVQVGGLFAWLQRSLLKDDLLEVTVHYGDGGARIGASWADARHPPFWRVVDSTSAADVVDALAYEIAYRKFVERVPAAGALTADEVETLLGELDRLVDLKGRLRRGRQPDAEEFGSVLDDIEGLVRAAPEWHELQLLAADIAEHADRYELALDLYAASRESLPAESALAADLEARIDDLNEELRSRLASADAATRYVAATRGAGAGGAPVESADRPLLPGEAAVRTLLGIDDLAMARPVTIGLLGVPAADVLASGDAVLGPSSGDASHEDYVRSVVDTVRMVAPDTRFLFSSFQSSSHAELLTAARRFLLEDGAPDVLLVPYGPLQLRVWRPLFDEFVRRGSVVVLPAGNRPDEGNAFLDDASVPILVAAAVDLEGNAAPFTQYGPGCVWAPGVEIPVIEEGGVRLRGGTSYSAAFAAAIAARVIAEREGMDPAEVVRLLRETATARVDGGWPILDLSAALSRATR